MHDITRILSSIDRPAHGAAEQILPLVYEQLRSLAAAQLSHEPAGLTLQATALVHEAWLRLLNQSGPPSSWNGRGHFFSAVAEAMRRILIEQARRKSRIKHGGLLSRVELDDVPDQQSSADQPASVAFDLSELDEALSKFEREEPEKAQLVKLRYYVGLSNEAAATAMGISPATAKRYWAYSRAWLYDEIYGEEQLATPES